MSISGALSNALSGLTAAARSAEIVSSNLANAMTEGYGRRQISLSSQNLRASGGVLVNGVVRHSNPALLAERRLADAEFGNASALNNFFNQLEMNMGTPDKSSSLSGRLATFQSSLIGASGAPESQTRLQTVARDAAALVDTFNTAASDIKTSREQADRSIGTMVERLNTLLSRTEEMNQKISAAINQGRDTSALEDDRQKLIDEISVLVPTKSVARDRGGVALYTTSGAILLDGKAPEIGFEPTPTILPHMTLEGGLLSGLTVGDVSLDGAGALAGGALAAQFDIRDTHAPQAQAELDAAARNLVERFQSSGVDPTLASGQAGLFTDQGSAFGPTDEVGLSGRLRLNALVDPDGANEAWRLRAGLGAAGPGLAGDATLLNAMSDVLAEKRNPGSGSHSSSALSMGQLSERVLSAVAADRVKSDEELSFSANRLFGLQEAELSEGVDSDHEMQLLMLIEQAYAANARVIETVDEMMSQLLRL